MNAPKLLPPLGSSRPVAVGHSAAHPCKTSESRFLRRSLRCREEAVRRTWPLPRFSKRLRAIPALQLSPALIGWPMGTFRQGSLARRLAVGLIAIDVFLFQAFAPTAAALAHHGAVTCEMHLQGQGSGKIPPTHHHGTCCIVGCVTCCAAYVAAVAGFAENLARQPALVGFSETPSFASPALLEIYFSARGPPEFR
jgi:hypothetical protein